MPRPKKAMPKYGYHISGQAIITLDGKTYYLGPHNSPESHARYLSLISEYQANDLTMPDGVPTHQKQTAITVLCVAEEFREHIKVKYANNPTEAGRFRSLCTTLDDEYGDLPATEFGPRKLSDLRDLFVASGNCRKYVNSQTRNVVRIFRHAVARELVDADVLIRLETLEPLRYGQTPARETAKRGPVPLSAVRSTVKHLSPTIVAMIRIQVATAMRPSEVCNMRPCDIDQRGREWMYRPESHKTARLGITKAVPIVGDARIALRPFLENRAPDDFCFQPRESAQWYRDQRTAARVTPIHLGSRVGYRHDGLKGDSAQNRPGKRYSKDSYRRAIQRAAEKANVQHWTPYQLRYTNATAVREALGVEYAQALLGHSRSTMTEHYAELSEEKAIKAAKASPVLG